MHIFQALLLAAVLLSGCTGDGGGTEEVATVPAVEAPAAGAATPVPEATPLPIVAECSQTRTQAGTPFGYGLYADRAVLGADGCALDAMFDLPPSSFASGLVEVTWADLQASVTGVNAWMESSACQATPLMDCGLPRERGNRAPVRVELDAEFLQEWGESGLRVVAAAEGLAVQQEFQVYVTMFPVGEPPSGYTAIPD